MKMTSHFFRFFFLVTLNLPYLFGQTPNRPTPFSVPGYEFSQLSQAPSGDYILAPFKLSNNSISLSSITILDKNGFIKWFLNRPNGNMGNFNYFSNHSKFVFNYTEPPLASHFITLDNNFNLLDSIQNVNGIDNDLHENLLLPNGNWIISGKTDSIVDLSAHTLDGAQGSATTSIVAFVIQEFDVNENLVFQWNSNDHIHPAECYHNRYGYDPNNFDYCHGNAIEKDSDGHYLVSLRHLNSIYKVSSNDGHVIWRLGGKSNDFTFTNDLGFSGQHDIRVLPNGNYTLYDNGNMSGPPRKSRAVEYQLDTIIGQLPRYGNMNTHHLSMQEQWGIIKLRPIIFIL